MKHDMDGNGLPIEAAFSALGRAVWDETQFNQDSDYPGLIFQCSRSSRMG